MGQGKLEELPQGLVLIANQDSEGVAAPRGIDAPALRFIDREEAGG